LLLARWPVDVAGDVSPVGDVFRVEGADRQYVLKPIDKSRRRARFICSLTEYLGRGAYPLTPALIRTRDGSLLTTDAGGRHWILCEWISGRTCDWSDLQDALRCAEALARFHAQARDYCPLPNEKPRVYWNQWPGRLAGRLDQLKGYSAAAERSVAAGAATHFERLVAAQSPRQISYAEDSLAVLAASQYPVLCAQYRRRGQVIHGDPAGRNFVLTGSGEVRIIDLESVRQDVPVLDLAKLMRRVLKAHRWRPDVAREVLSSYSSALVVEPAMLPILYAFVAYPMKFYRDVHRYYAAGDGRTGYHHLRKLVRHLWQEKGKRGLLEWLGAGCTRARYMEAANDHS
jgi:spore coat protein I